MSLPSSRASKKAWNWVVGMIAHVAGVEHLHGELAPGGLVGVQLHGVELVVEQAALAAAEVGVEVVGLQAVHHGGGLADAAVLEVDEGDAGGVVFVGLEDVAASTWWRSW
jgi:hypothetical protein